MQNQLIINCQKKKIITNCITYSFQNRLITNCKNINYKLQNQVITNFKTNCIIYSLQNQFYYICEIVLLQIVKPIYFKMLNIFNTKPIDYKLQIHFKTSLLQIAERSDYRLHNQFNVVIALWVSYTEPSLMYINKTITSYLPYKKKRNGIHNCTHIISL